MYLHLESTNHQKCSIFVSARESTTGYYERAVLDGRHYKAPRHYTLGPGYMSKWTFLWSQCVSCPRDVYWCKNAAIFTSEHTRPDQGKYYPFSICLILVCIHISWHTCAWPASSPTPGDALILLILDVLLQIICMANIRLMYLPVTKHVFFAKESLRFISLKR
jgi:hypothetical protein